MRNYLFSTFVIASDQRESGNPESSWIASSAKDKFCPSRNDGKRKKGFTLVELSIVFVIIGFLIGGILVGRSMIETVKINAQVRQFQQFDIATTTFKQKFNQIPGDCSFCQHHSNVLFKGNNNGVLESFTISATGALQLPAEFFYPEVGYFFSDLSQVGMLSERYVIGTNQVYWSVGKGNQFPQMKLGNNPDYGLYPLSGLTGEIYYLGLYRSFIYNGWIGYQEGPTMTPLQLAAIDKKMDDGVPNSGEVTAGRHAPNTGGAACSSNATPDNYPMCFDWVNLTTSCTRIVSGSRIYNTHNNIICYPQVSMNVDLK